MKKIGNIVIALMVVATVNAQETEGKPQTVQVQRVEVPAQKTHPVIHQVIKKQVHVIKKKEDNSSTNVLSLSNNQLKRQAHITKEKPHK